MNTISNSVSVRITVMAAAFVAQSDNIFALSDGHHFTEGVLSFERLRQLIEPPAEGRPVFQHGSIPGQNRAR